MSHWYSGPNSRWNASRRLRISSVSIRSWRPNRERAVREIDWRICQCPRRREGNERVHGPWVHGMGRPRKKLSIPLRNYQRTEKCRFILERVRESLALSAGERLLQPFREKSASQRNVMTLWHTRDVLPNMQPSENSKYDFSKAKILSQEFLHKSQK